MRYSTDEFDRTQICAYYEQTWSAYRVIWNSPAHPAMHFGYWDQNTRSHAESLINMNRQVALRAQVQAESRVLDAGCGAGGTSLWLAETCGATVTGISIVDTDVERARQFARRRGLEQQVCFKRQDYLCTDFPDGHFDVVVAQESVCHARNKRGFLDEAFRVLKPGGRLVIQDGFRSARPHSPNDERLLHSGLSAWAVPDLATRDEIVAWTQAVGFCDVVFEDISAQTRPSHRRLATFALIFYPYSWLFYTLGWRAPERHANVQGALAQWRALKRGLWFEGILSAKKPA